MSPKSCIACGRQFSDDAILAAVTWRAARGFEHPESAAITPLCEDHGLRHLETPETRAAFKPSYFSESGQDQDGDEHLTEAEIDLQIAHERIQWSKGRRKPRKERKPRDRKVLVKRKPKGGMAKRLPRYTPVSAAQQEWLNQYKSISPHLAESHTVPVTSAEPAADKVGTTKGLLL